MPAAEPALSEWRVHETTEANGSHLPDFQLQRLCTMLPSQMAGAKGCAAALAMNSVVPWSCQIGSHISMDLGRSLSETTNEEWTCRASS